MHNTNVFTSEQLAISIEQFDPIPDDIPAVRVEQFDPTPDDIQGVADKLGPSS